MTLDEPTLKAAHKHCSLHREEVLASELCGCFHCQKTFAPSAIEEWTDNEQTAHCPECWIDSVIGDKSGYPVISPTFLTAMHAYWFERTVYVEYQ